MRSPRYVDEPVKVSWPLWAAMAATVLLSLVPFFRVGFTTGDDLKYFWTAQQSWQYWLMDSQTYALQQGRFYFLLTKFFYYVPYLADNFLVAKTIQYAMLVVCYALFAYVAGRVARSRWVAALTMLLLVFLTAVPGTSFNHIAITAYPFFFTFSFALLLCGVLAYVNYYERGGRWRPVWGSVLMLCAALFYENYVVFMLLVVLYIVLRHWRREGFGALWRSGAFYREAVPLAAVVALYAGAYFGYRSWAGSDVYDGAAVGGAFSLNNFFRVVRRCTLIALPGQNYFHGKRLIAESCTAAGGFRNTPLFVMAHAPLGVWANAVLQGILFQYIARRLELRRLGWRRLLVIAGGALLFAFSANALIAITPKYNQEWAQWMKGYVTSFYSYFGLALTLAAAVALTLKAAHNERLHSVLRGVWTVLIVFFALLIGYANDSLSRSWQQSQNLFTTLDQMGRDHAFDSLPDDAIVCTERLHSLSRTTQAITRDSRHLEEYLSLRAGRKLLCATSQEELETLLAAHPEAAVCHLYAATNRQGELLVAMSCGDTTRCWFLSPDKAFTLFYRANGQWQQREVLSDKPRERFATVEVCASDIEPYSFTVSTLHHEND